MPPTITPNQLFAKVQQQAGKIAELELIIEALETALKAGSEEAKQIASDLTAERPK